MLISEAPTRPFTAAEFAAALGSLANFEHHPFLAVAVSGGPDSLALAILADRWSRERGGQTWALTVDHGLRQESGDEIRRLRGWLSAREIRHEILVWSGPKPTTGIQEAARAARYRLLSSWCREHGCLHLLTAHHREDQIETHLIRRRAHSGEDGLAGMSGVRELADCRLLRPLLGVAKDRLAVLLRIAGQDFITDRSNSDPAFERSLLRAADAANPDAADFVTLLAAIGTFGSDRRARESVVNELLARAVTLHPGGFAILDPGPILAVSPEIADRVFSAVVATIGGTAYPARRARVARLREVITSRAKGGHTLGGCRFVRWRDRVLVYRELARVAAPIRLSPGASISWDGRFRVGWPMDAAGPVIVRYLGVAGVSELGRLARIQRRGHIPRLLLPILPSVWDEDGIAAVPHLAYRREATAVLPHIVFRPVNPLTRAGFAVV